MSNDIWKGYTLEGMTQELFISKNKELYGNKIRYCFGVDDPLKVALSVLSCDLGLFEMRAIFPKDDSDVQIGNELLGFKVLASRMKSEGFLCCLFKFKTEDEDYIDISVDTRMLFMNIYLEDNDIVPMIKKELKKKGIREK